MCEYQIADPKGRKLLLCSVDNKICTFCVMGNAKTYNEAKKKEGSVANEINRNNQKSR